MAQPFDGPFIFSLLSKARDPLLMDPSFQVYILRNVGGFFSLTYNAQFLTTLTPLAEESKNLKSSSNQHAESHNLSHAVNQNHPC